MKAILTALAAAATLAAATATSFAADSVRLTGALVVSAAANVQPPAYLAKPEPGYIVYAGYAGALPGPNCYWTRMPVYDSIGKVIGWRGRPVAVCP